ncbi:MAG: CDP-glycerol glycerophosphotransferase family protein, partial [Desulfovibrio sp.]|nr:CDP-glycerol glycerophosphotransferase family protein [Desulfovibrio sp.]
MDGSEMKIFQKALLTLIKFFLKGFTAKNFEDGSCAIYLRLPFKFNTKYLFAATYGLKPIDPRKIVFDNYMGKGYGCNPKYVAEALNEKYPGKFDIVWIVSEKDKLTGEIPDWIRTVSYKSKKAIEEFATAKVWVSNYHKISFIRRGGLYRRDG